MTSVVIDDWHASAAALHPESRLFINGDWIDSASGETFPTIAPRNGTVISSIAAGSSVDVDRAVGAARRAFETGPWRRMAPRERKHVLRRWAELVRENADELGLLETLDVGKPISVSRAGDAMGVAVCLEWYAESADKVYGEIAPTGNDALAMITREPLGVIGAVVPWNYPMVIATWKIAPALISGNSIVIKPAEQSPLSILRLAQLGQEAGLPDGVLNIVNGYGITAGQALGRHLDVDKIAFTGSGPVGKLFQVYAGESNGKSVQIEAGGKSPHLVLDDASDLKEIAETIARGFCFNAGQSCSAGTRLIVASSIRDELMENLLEAVIKYQAADPLDASTTMGPLIDDKQLDRVLGYINLARAEGAEIVTGGNQVNLESGGYFVEPTVLEGLAPTSRVIKDEIFGPVLTVSTFDSVEEGVRIANDTSFGLAAAIWSGSLSAHKVANQLRAGTVWINTYAAVDVMTPFGGFGASGHGRDKSLHAIDEYTGLKTTWLKL